MILKKFQDDHSLKIIYKESWAQETQEVPLEFSPNPFGMNILKSRVSSKNYPQVVILKGMIHLKYEESSKNYHKTFNDTSGMIFKEWFLRNNALGILKFT